MTLASLTLGSHCNVRGFQRTTSIKSRVLCVAAVRDPGRDAFDLGANAGLDRPGVDADADQEAADERDETDCVWSKRRARLGVDVLRS